MLSMRISHYIYDNAEFGKLQEECYNVLTKAKNKSLFGLRRESVHGLFHGSWRQAPVRFFLFEAARDPVSAARALVRG